MKKIIIGIIAAAVLAAGAIFVVAQKARHGGGHEFGRGRGMGMFLRGLDLTDDQKAKVKEIMTASHAAVEPTMASVKEVHQKMTAATAGGAFDQAQVEAIANEQAGLMAKMMVEREKAKSQIFALLTDAQKAKAAEMRAKFEQRFKDGRGFEGKPKGSDF
jgi:periplasmic protein CpxP/Spy